MSSAATDPAAAAAAAGSSSRLRRSTHHVVLSAFDLNRFEDDVWYKGTDVMKAGSNAELTELTTKRGFQSAEVTSEEIAAAGAQADSRPVLQHYLRKVILVSPRKNLVWSAKRLEKQKLFQSLPNEHLDGLKVLYSCGVCAAAHRPNGRTCIFYQPLAGVIAHIRRDHSGLHLPRAQTAASKKYLAKATELLGRELRLKNPRSSSRREFLDHPLTRRNFPTDKLTIDASSDQGLQQYLEMLRTRDLYPMDLGTVYERLVTDQYASVSEAAKDADVATQCMLAFHSPDSSYYSRTESVQHGLLSSLDTLAEKEHKEASSIAAADNSLESERAHEASSQQVCAMDELDESDHKESDQQVDISAESSASPPAASPRPPSPPPAEEDAAHDVVDLDEKDDASDRDDGDDDAIFSAAHQQVLASKKAMQSKYLAQITALQERNAQLDRQLAESQKREAALRAQLDTIKQLVSPSNSLAAAPAAAAAAAATSSRREPIPTSGQKRKYSDTSLPSRAANQEEGEATAPGGPKKRKESIAPA